MEQIINLHVEKLSDGYYLARSDEVPGLVAQRRAVAETLKIAHDVARRLLDARAERNESIGLRATGDSFRCQAINRFSADRCHAAVRIIRAYLSRLTVKVSACEAGGVANFLHLRSL